MPKNPAREKALKLFYKDVRQSSGRTFGKIISDIFDQWFTDLDCEPTIENTRDDSNEYTVLTSDYIDNVKKEIRHQSEIG